MQRTAARRTGFWRVFAPASSFITLAAGATAPSSLFIVYRAQRGFTPGDIALVFAAYVSTLLPVLLVMSTLANRISRTRLVTASILFAAAGMACLALAPGLPLLVAGRMLQGISVGLGIGALTAAFTESYRGTLPLGTAVQAMATVGLGGGPLITAVAFNMGGGLHWSYLLTLLMTLALLAVVTRISEPSVRSAATPAGETTLDARTVGRGLAFAMPVIFVSWGSLSIFLSLMPAYLATSLHAENPLVGAAAIISAQISSFSATLLFRKSAPERNALVAPAVMLAGLILLVIGTTYTLWALIGVSTVLVGGGAGVAAAAAFSLAERVGRGQRDRVFARMYVAAYLGYSVPAITIGAIAARHSLAAGLLTVIGVLTAIAACLPWLRGRVHTMR